MSDETRIVGGLLVGINGRLYSTSVRHELAYCPHCWRCGRQMALDTTNLVPGDAESHPWVWCCDGCVSPDDVIARDNPEGRGVR